MSVDYTTTALLSNIKRKLQIPTGDTKLSDTELIAIADDEMRSYVIPKLLRTHEDYFVEQGTVAIVANQQAYVLPAPVNAATINSVSLIRANGTAQDLFRLTVKDVDRYNGQTAQYPTHYVLQGEKIVLLPTPTDATNTLRIRFERMPGRLVAVSSTVTPTIASVSGATYTMSAAPGWTQGVTYVTAYRSGPPFNCAFGYALVATVASTAVTFGTPLWGATTDAYVSGPSDPHMYPDYICEWNLSPVVPLPEAWHPTMLYAASSAAAREYGDAQLADYLRGEMETRIEMMMQAASSRARYDEQVVFHRGSMMRAGFGRYMGRP